MTESSLKVIHIKLKEDFTLYSPSSNFIRQLTTLSAAMQLTSSYALYLIDKKDFRSLSSLLPSIAISYIDSVTDIFPDGFMHSVVVGLAPHLHTIREQLLVIIMKEFFLPCARHSESCLLYLCLFIRIGYKKMNHELVEEMLDVMQPSSDQVDDVLIN